MNSDYDRISIFNSLTHDENGQMDDIVFDRLIDDFDLFVVFTKLHSKTKEKNKLMKAESDDKLHFKVQFTNDKVTQDFINSIEAETIKYKSNIYRAEVDFISEHIIDITFILIK